MEKRTTATADSVIELAKDEARTLGHSYLGTEHLLAGLVREQDGAAAAALEDHGVTLAAIEATIDDLIGKGDLGLPPNFDVAPTPRVESIMGYALREALRLGHDYIGSEHLLLALLTEGNGVAIAILDDLNIDREQLRKSVLDSIVTPDDPNLWLDVQIKSSTIAAAIRWWDRYSRANGPFDRNHPVERLIAILRNTDF